MIVLFTIGAVQGRRGERKARDSNPHSPKGGRFSKAVRQTVSGYLPERRTEQTSGPAGESNPDLLVASQASSRWTSRPITRTHPGGPPESRTRSPSLQERNTPGTPADHPVLIERLDPVVPEGVEPPFPLCKRGVVAIGPRDGRHSIHPLAREPARHLHVRCTSPIGHCSGPCGGGALPCEGKRSQKSAGSLIIATLTGLYAFGGLALAAYAFLALHPVMKGLGLILLLFGIVNLPIFVMWSRETAHDVTSWSGLLCARTRKNPHASAEPTDRKTAAIRRRLGHALHPVARVGVEPTDIRLSSLTAMPVRLPCRRECCRDRIAACRSRRNCDRAGMRARESNHGVRVYETRPSARPARSEGIPGPGTEPGEPALSEPGGAPATAAEPFDRNTGHNRDIDKASILRYPSSPEGIRTPFSTLSGWHPGQ